MHMDDDDTMACSQSLSAAIEIPPGRRPPFLSLGYLQEPVRPYAWYNICCCALLFDRLSSIRMISEERSGGLRFC